MRFKKLTLQSKYQVDSTVNNFMME